MFPNFDVSFQLKFEPTVPSFDLSCTPTRKERFSTNIFEIKRLWGRGGTGETEITAQKNFNFSGWKWIPMDFWN